MAAPESIDEIALFHRMLTDARIDGNRRLARLCHRALKGDTQAAAACRQRIAKLALAERFAAIALPIPSANAFLALWEALSQYVENNDEALHLDPDNDVLRALTEAARALLKRCDYAVASAAESPERTGES